MTDSNQQQRDEENVDDERGVSRRAVLGAVGTGAGLGALPSTARSGGLSLAGEDGFVPVSGTASEEYVLGQGTAF